MNNDEKELLQRFGWMLFDGINRRLGILVEECRHLQQVVHYHGDFDIFDRTSSSDEQQPKMEHFKQSSYAHDKSFSFVAEALYDHLGGLIIGLKALQTEVRERFENFLSAPADTRYEHWFWFVALRGHLLQVVLDQYMLLLEHAHEKLIQILETKPGQLPQAILLRRWNSALHGRFLSEYSRHLEWETHELFNDLKKNPLPEEELDKRRHRSSFIHSWAHTPTSMVKTFLVDDDHPTKKPKQKERYQLGSIRSAFFYLEMPQLYPLLYHECAHLQFDWDMETVDNDEGYFFRQRRKAIGTLEEECEPYRIDIRGGWQNFVNEICADMLAVSLGDISYFNALVLQLMGQGAGCFFHSDESLPLQEWAKQRVYDTEQAGTAYDDLRQGKSDDYFWQARILLALNCLRQIHSESCNEHDNQLWLKAVELGIEAYQKGGEVVFAAHKVSAQHQYFWGYRKSLNEWVYETVADCRLSDAIDIKHAGKKFFTRKYQLDKNIIDTVLSPSVRIFENKFFNSDHRYNNEICKYGLTVNEKGKGIEYLVFHVKWYLSKRVIKEVSSILGEKSKNKCVEIFTYTYANFIHDCSAGIFRLALEWIVARNDLYMTFINYFEDPSEIEFQFKKLDIPQELKNQINPFVFQMASLCDFVDSGKLTEEEKKILCDSMSKILGIAIITSENICTKKEELIEVIKNKYPDNQNKFEMFLGEIESHTAGSYKVGIFSYYNENVSNIIYCLRYLKSESQRDITNQVIKQIEQFVVDYMKGEVTQRFFELHVESGGVSIGTFTLGSFSKNRIKKAKSKSLYLDGAEAVYNYYYAVTNCINDPKSHCTHARMPYNYDESKKTGHDVYFKYHGIGPEDYQSSLYFITGDYDFIHHQDGITPSEFTCHPYRQLPILTKSRTVLDLGRNFDASRQPYGRISLIKFRYRWEMYHLASYLKVQKYRSRLRLSSAWEDGLLTTWHENEESFWGEAYPDGPLVASNAGGVMDSQSSLILFKLDDEVAEIRKPMTADGKTEISCESLSSSSGNKLPEIIDGMKGNGMPFDEVYVSQGRFDYTVEWVANTPEELAKSMFSLPDNFWRNTAHINTSFGHKLKENCTSRFLSEITINIFPSIIFKKI